MSTMITLEWKPLVRIVRAGYREFDGDSTAGPFMFIECEGFHAFVSDKDFLKNVLEARGHMAKNEPILFIAPKKTGKSVFLNLVARGGRTNDRNVTTRGKKWSNPQVTEDSDDCYFTFFGPQGVVALNKDGLIHFDCLENARKNSRFLKALLRLVTEKILVIEDREGTLRELAVPDLFVVGGGVKSPTEVGEESGTNPIWWHLFPSAHWKGTFTTKLITDQLDRLEQLLAERIAAEVTYDTEKESRAHDISTIPSDVVSWLKTEYTWPYQFEDLVQFVSTALKKTDWKIALAQLQKNREQKHPGRLIPLGKDEPLGHPL